MREACALAIIALIRTELTGGVDDDAKDWRSHAQAELAQEWTSPWGGQTFPKGSIVTQAVSVPLAGKMRTLFFHVPNSTALFLSVAHREYQAARAIAQERGVFAGLAKQAVFASNDEMARYFEGMFTAVIAAYTAIEAFANEVIPDDVVYTRERNGAKETLGKDAIERRLPLSEKLGQVIPSALNLASPKSHRSWHDFHRLEQMRDRLIHMKSGDRKATGLAKGTIWHDIVLFPSPTAVATPILDYLASKINAKRGWHHSRPFDRVAEAK